MINILYSNISQFILLYYYNMSSLLPIIVYRRDVPFGQGIFPLKLNLITNILYIFQSKCSFKQYFI